MLRDYHAIERKMKQIDTRKIEEARKRYWDARNLPRKKKKQARKEAVIDFNFWKSMAEYDIFT